MGHSYDGDSYHIGCANDDCLGAIFTPYGGVNIINASGDHGTCWCLEGVDNDEKRALVDYCGYNQTLKNRIAAYNKLSECFFITNDGLHIKYGKYGLCTSLFYSGYDEDDEPSKLTEFKGLCGMTDLFGLRVYATCKKCKVKSKQNVGFVPK